MMKINVLTNLLISIFLEILVIYVNGIPEDLNALIERGEQLKTASSQIIKRHSDTTHGSLLLQVITTELHNLEGTLNQIKREFSNATKHSIEMDQAEQSLLTYSNVVDEELQFLNEVYSSLTDANSTGNELIDYGHRLVVEMETIIAKHTDPNDANQIEIKILRLHLNDIKEKINLVRDEQNPNKLHQYEKKLFDNERKMYKILVRL